MKLEDLPVLLDACCVLHNICEMRNEEIDSEWKFEIFDDEMVVENGIRSSAAEQARDTNYGVVEAYPRNPNTYSSLIGVVWSVVAFR